MLKKVVFSYILSIISSTLDKFEKKISFIVVWNNIKVESKEIKWGRLDAFLKHRIHAQRCVTPQNDESKISPIVKKAETIIHTHL